MKGESARTDLGTILQISQLPSLASDVQSVLRGQFPMPRPDPSASPQLIAIGGGPGAGKSYFYEHLKAQTSLPKTHVLHDPDVIMQAIPEYQRDYRVDPIQAFQQWELPARHMSHTLLLDAVMQGQTIVYLRSLALADSLLLLKYLKNIGYEIIIHLLTCTMSTALRRIDERQASIHRHLPQDLIVQRHNAVMAHIPSLQSIADRYCQYDNSEDGKIL